VYKRKRKQKNLSEESLVALAWDVEEYETLITKNAEIRKLIAEVKEMLPTPEQQGNLARALRQLRDDLKAYVKNVTMKKREAASHLLIFMISDEQRAMKPYAIPVRVLPYKSITDADNSITTRAHHDAVPHEDVIWLHEFMRDNNVPFERAIHILRRTHFPFHYNPHPGNNLYLFHVIISGTISLA